MRLVIADTGPVNYLILIGHIEILPRMFERVVLPDSVQTELSNPVAPLEVRKWIANPPDWLEVMKTQGIDPIAGIHKAEADAITLAEVLQADLLLIDERRGFRTTKRRGLPVTGTLGVLDFAADRGLIDFALAIQKLEGTSFRRPEAVLDALLTKHAAGGTDA